MSSLTEMLGENASWQSQESNMKPDWLPQKTNDRTMPPSISLRHYLRWLPDPAPDEDNTSTIVTTSSENRFVDLRVLKTSPPTDPTTQDSKTQPLSQLEWGLAGTSSSTPEKGPRGEAITHGIWKHWIDSRSPDADGVQDEGDNYPQPGGLVLEKGSMENPATGKVTRYEELWEDLDVQHAESETGKVQCVVLQVHDDSRQLRGLVVRVGQFCQGFMRSGSDVGVERWEWSADSWKRSVKMGEMSLPCAEAMDPVKLKLGGQIACGEQDWTVLELSAS